jgi:hypothetical protein
LSGREVFFALYAGGFKSRMSLAAVALPVLLHSGIPEGLLVQVSSHVREKREEVSSCRCERWHHRCSIVGE